MKPTPIVAVLAFAVITVSAWDLTVYMKDGRHVETHGTLDSGCKTYDFDMSSPVNHVVFHKSRFAGTFELYGQKGCGGPVSYRNGDGDFRIVPRVIQSYKVY
jgi:hypothetical protein